MDEQSPSNRGPSKPARWVLRRRKCGATHSEITGRYTRETDAIADRERFRRAFPLSVFTVERASA